MRLTDLRDCDCGHWTGCNAKATVADLVDALIAEGGETIRLCPTHRQVYNFYAGCYHRRGCGPAVTYYLVPAPIIGEEET